MSPLTYVLGLSGEQVTEFDGSGAWQHTNVFNGQLLAYDNRGLHFPQTDPLGTARVQVSGTGAPEESCASLPFGDGLTCTPGAIDPTEHHFTGKERDTESGLDYFGASRSDASLVFRGEAVLIVLAIAHAVWFAAHSGFVVPEIVDGRYVIDDHGRIIKELTEDQYFSLRGAALRMTMTIVAVLYFLPTSYWFLRSRKTETA